MFCLFTEIYRSVGENITLLESDITVFQTKSQIRIIYSIYILLNRWENGNNSSDEHL
jgi:hypothetical protein